MPSCPSCGQENPEGFAFCGYCAAPLAAAAEIFEERKVVSILFCDLVGFTATSERQDPEDVRARLRPYHARVRQEIERHGGTVEKFVGDAVMAAFGAPVAHEDDAERAVRAGLEILRAIGELNASLPGLDLKVRVGINTGEAVVSVGAQPERGDALVTGDVVNTANRIESVAPENGVAVSEQTYRATSHIFEYAPLEPVSVKGKSEPLALWHATAVRIRFGTDFHEHTTPLVGRELEKALLIGIYERAMQRRSVQLVTVAGEPGVGKSRMVAELFAYMDAKPELVRWRQGRCLPYGEGITFWALGEIVKREAAILESDPGGIALAKLDAAVPPDDPDRHWLIQRLAPLVGAEGAAPAERQESFTAWRRYLEALAARRETVLVFEDLHWADEALLAFLEHLAEWSEDVPLLIVCTARPELYERRAGWAAGQRNAHTMNLSPLSDAETAELVASLTTTALQPELEAAVLERAGGNPLYAEELVRLLADRALSVEALTLPDSVQALIAARLDTLSAERKGLLQDAAVLGKVFWASAVAQMGGVEPEHVELALHELARKELVRPGRTSSMQGESEYSFWHLLVRDVAYAQIPRSQRAQRHRAAAEWIERKAGDRVEDLAEVLAHHYVQALELAEAAGDARQVGEVAAPARTFLALAGERALGLDTIQAEQRLRRALELTALEDPGRVALLVRWADAAFQAAAATEAAAALDEALPALRTGADVELCARALQLRSRISQRRGEGRQVGLAEEAVELLERRPIGHPLVTAYEQLANVQMVAGAYDETIRAADRATELASGLDLAEPARALGYRGFARSYLGDVEGLAEMERALELLVASGAGRDAAILQNNLSIARYPLHGPLRSLADVDAAVEFCAQRGLRESIAQLEANRPGLLVELGHATEAVEEAERLLRETVDTDDLYARIEIRAVAAACRVSRNDTVAADELRSLVETARTIGTVDIMITAFSAASAGAVQRGELSDAAGWLAELARMEGVKRSTYYFRSLAGMIRVALRTGELRLAEHLSAVVPPDTPLGTHVLRSVSAQLAEYRGNHEHACALYSEAARGWHEFGNVPERAYALLGHGRCLRALRASGAEESLLEARELLASMAYGPALAEVDALLREPAPASS